ncbi:MAG: (2Fe-2S) ferredoxin domain-containing protein [Candidatus Neoclostridium sp.]
MLKLTVCIGSSCHIKGSRQVVGTFKELIEKNSLQNDVELAGTFCMGRCQEGVCVKLNDEFFSVSPASAEGFFNENVLSRV